MGQWGEPKELTYNTLWGRTEQHNIQNTAHTCITRRIEIWGGGGGVIKTKLKYDTRGGCKCFRFTPHTF